MREHDAAGRAQLIESMLPRLLELCAGFQELHEAVWQDLFAGGVREVQSLGEDLQQTWADALVFLGNVRDNGRECLAGGFLIARFEELEQAMTAVERISEEHAARWPWIDKETVARSRADVAAGRCHNAKEVLDALRSPTR
jgi:hypothetical protein